ncbi:hypothetical protein ACF1CG_29620 [Streptomyces sp. NPDC014773]|uniref:hypothetical protein n=1 Tax=Streptomyces sp. NPDC014773 TaxID=3364908 RepID=UPI003701832F
MESRKAACLAYAAAFRERLDQLREAILDVTVVDHVSPSEAPALFSHAQELLDEPTEELAHAERSTVAVNPRTVTERSVTASRRLREYEAAVRIALSSEAESREARVEDAKKAHASTYDAYLDFLHAASEDLGDYDVLRRGA